MYVWVCGGACPWMADASKESKHSVFILSVPGNACSHLSSTQRGSTRGIMLSIKRLPITCLWGGVAEVEGEGLIPQLIIYIEKGEMGERTADPLR